MFSPHRFSAATLAALVLLALDVSAAPAQTVDPAQKHKPNPYGSPLDTLMSTHLWTDVPPAQDFVKQTRPAPKDLDYTSMNGKDPDRPKPRDKANIAALQAELEQGGARNAVKARGLTTPAKRSRAKAKGAD